MSNRNRTQATPPMSQNERIRRLWPDFKQSVSKSRTLLDHKVEALLDKAEKEYEKTAPERRRSIEQHTALKAKLAKETRVPHFRSVRRQWELKLQEVGLRMEDWTDISNEEMTSVIDVLGDPEDEPDEGAIVPDRPSPPNPTFSSVPLSTYTTSPPQSLAPSISSSTRSTNVSTTSSYALVDPSEFHSEEEDSGFYFPVATSYDLTSDDDERPTRRSQNRFDAWSSDSSSHHSFDDPSNTAFPSSALPSGLNGRKMTSAGKQAASLKAKEEVAPKARQSYVGPIVSDPDEPLSEEDDFERFKMTVRFQKIIEFHQAAAHADIELAFAIYKDRMSQNSDKHEESSKVTNHQKRMIQLQMEKEEERKNIVKAERSKRRSELRRRPGRSGTVIAPRPSVPANPSWLNTFQEQVAEGVESNIALDKILSNDPDEQQGNVEKLLGQLFPGSSTANEERYDHFAPAVGQSQYPSTGPNGWSASTTSFPRPTDVNHEPVKRFSNGRSTKHNNVRIAKPSLFGEDPESSDEEEEDSPSPPVSVNPPQQNNPFMNAEVDSMLSNHLLVDPELYSYINQWGTTGELPSMPTPTTPWGISQTAQTPTADDPWRIKSTPVATRGKFSFSGSLSASTQNPHSFMAEQSAPMSLATLAALNSANANAREKQPVVVDERRPALEPVKKFSPSQSVPTALPNAVPAPAPSTSTQTSNSQVTLQAKADLNPMSSVIGKKASKKQRQAMKKVGASSEDSTQASEFPTPPETTPMATIFEQIPQPGTKSISPQADIDLNANVGRGRKDSTSLWGELLSTPRPASNLPAHLREIGLKSENALQGVNRPVEQFRPTSGMSTIKAPQRGSGSALKNRSVWSIFSSGEPGPSKPQTETALPSGGRDLWIPGGFEVNDGGGGGGGGGHDDQMINDPSFSAQFSAPVPAVHNNLSMSAPVAPFRSNDVSSSSAANSQAVPVPPHPSGLSPTSKKSKNKKGKGKRVSVEEIPEEEEHCGERLPLDHRYIMESSTILEPKPSVPSRMFDSIIAFGDEDEDESSSSSFAAASNRTSSSPPPNLFDGDSARLAAAMQEIQESSARMEKKFATTPAWGVANGVKSEPDASTPIFSWGRPTASSDKKKGSASNSAGNNNAIPKPVIAPAIQNLKRSRAASGGKLL